MIAGTPFAKNASCARWGTQRQTLVHVTEVPRSRSSGYPVSKYVSGWYGMLDTRGPPKE